jgi:GAF domain-containing protein
MSTPTTREPALTTAFIDIADTMVVGYDLIDMAHRLAGHCVRLLDVAAAGLLLTDGQGNLGVLASSNEQAQLMELFQLQADHEGPCLDCFHTGSPVTAVDLPRWRERWPGFVSLAEEQGFRTVHALPMRLREHTIGTLNLFRTGVSPLSAEDLRLGQALADVATIAILQERALARSEVVVEQLQGALNSRVIIEQAKGVLSTSGHMSTDEAFTVLRGYARSHNHRLAELARAVVADADQARQVLLFVGTRS